MSEFMLSAESEQFSHDSCFSMLQLAKNLSNIASDVMIPCTVVLIYLCTGTGGLAQCEPGPKISA